MIRNGIRFKVKIQDCRITESESVALHRNFKSQNIAVLEVIPELFFFVVRNLTNSIVTIN